MSNSIHCSDADLAEFTLGGLDGPSRADVLAHLEHCDRCRTEATGFASTLDLLLLAVPAAPPAAGLTERIDAGMYLAVEQVPAHLDPPAHSSPNARLRRVLLAAAALVLIVSGVVGFVASRPSQPDIRTATMLDSFGSPMGRVELAGHRATIVVTRPDGYAPLATTEAYRLRVVSRTGAVPVAGPLRLGADDAWAGPLELDPSEVARVEVIDPRGRVVCHARLPAA